MTRSTSYTSLPRWLCMRVNADFVAGIVWTKSTSGNPGWQAPRWNIGCIFVHFCKLTINRRASLLQWLKPRDNKKLCTAPLSCKCQHGPEKILFVSHDYTFWRLLLLALYLRWSMTWKTTKNKTMEDGGMTVDFWIIKVHTFNLNSLWIMDDLVIE